LGRKNRQQNISIMEKNGLVPVSRNYLSVNDKVMMKDGRILTIKSLGYSDFLSIEEVGYILKKDISTIL
jgi:hypothetical protein